MMAMKQKAFESLTETIREMGKFLEGNAEALTPDVEYLRSMTIRIDICPEEYPVVNVDYDAISPEAVAAWGKSNE